MKAYETSTVTLKALLSHPLLQRDKIDETMEAMAEAAADQAEVDQAIRLGGAVVSAASGAAIDENELQEELQRMINEEKEREEVKMKEQQELERVQKEQEDAENLRQLIENEEDRNRLIQLVEEGRKTPVNSQEDDKMWEERWLAAQADKVVQAVRNREAELNQRARWDDENVVIPLTS